jgi:hypothetical protein
MVRIEIELGMWESAPCPIYTGKITDEDLNRAELELYQIMVDYYAYDEEMVNAFLNGEGDDYERDKFQDFLCEEEEKLVIEIGGKYYEDMTEEELSEVAKEYAVEEINAIGGLVDEMRAKFHNLRINVSGEKLEGRTIEIDGEVITLEEIDKCMGYLEEIRKFALYV